MKCVNARVGNHWLDDVEEAKRVCVCVCVGAPPRDEWADLYDMRGSVSDIPARSVFNSLDDARSCVKNTGF